MKPLSTYIVSDLDGVFFHGTRVQDGSAEFVDTVRNHRKGKITFASNGAGGPAAVVQKFRKAGIDIAEQDVMTAGRQMALRLQALKLQKKNDMRVLFLGPQELREECAEFGLEDMMSQEEVWDPKAYKWISDRTPTHVVTARHNYNQGTVEAAAAAIRRGGEWLATGGDHAVTTEMPGDLRAGTGTLVAAIQTLLKTSEGFEDAYPQLSGKPSPDIVQACLLRMGISPEHAAMLGDSLETDMTVAERLGLTRLLVRSGVTNPRMVAANPHRFDHQFAHIGELTDELKKQA